MKKVYLLLLPIAAMTLVGCRGGRGGGGGGGSTSTPTGQSTSQGGGGGGTTGGGGGGGTTNTAQPTVAPTSGGGGGGARETDDGWVEQIEAPTAGGEFIFGTYDETNSKFAFLDGNMAATYYLSCGATTSNAIKFTVETSGTGFKLKVTSGSQANKYLAITCTDGSHVNGSYAATGSVFDWVTDEEGVAANALGVSVDKGDGHGAEYYLLAMQPTKATLAPTYNRYWDTNYIGRLYAKAS